MRETLTPYSNPPTDCTSASRNDNVAPSDRLGHGGHTPRVKPLRLLRLRQVMQQTGLKKTKLYELQKEGAFPMRIQITSTAVGWVEEVIDAWIAGKSRCKQAAAHWIDNPTGHAREVGLVGR